MKSIDLVILRNDLRLDDNPALQAVTGKTLVIFPKEAKPSKLPSILKILKKS